MPVISARRGRARKIEPRLGIAGGLRVSSTGERNQNKKYFYASIESTKEVLYIF
jgi:hypothetical protein